MPWLRSRPSPLPPDESCALLAARLGAAFPSAAPAVEIVAAAAGEEIAVRWQDGPSTAAVRVAAGEVPGWSWEGSGDRRLRAERSYSDAAIARALVRFYGSQGRHYDPDDERRREAFVTLLDVDDPGRSGYPVVDAIADLLLLEADRSAEPGDDRVRTLSDRLRDAGYERLWAVAIDRVE